MRAETVAAKSSEHFRGKSGRGGGGGGGAGPGGG
eukprot:COSAG04_NODE_17246_length_474_cov_1.882667_2_plen_33_part_01